MRFSLKLFVLVGVFVGLRDVWGVEENEDDGFIVSEELKNNEKLKAAIVERRVIKAVYTTEVAGDVDIIHGYFKNQLNNIFVCVGKAVDEKNINGFNPDGQNRLYYYMKGNAEYTVYFIFKEECFEGTVEKLLNTTLAMFEWCKNLIHADFRFLNTTNVTLMSYMFDGCTALKELNFSNFNTKKVTTMDFMFYGCTSLKELNLSKFDTTSVISMCSMFRKCSALTELNLSNFKTPNVKDMSYMFQGCISLNKLNLSSFDTQNVTDMSSMFAGCTALKELNLSNFDFSNVGRIGDMFLGCKFDNLCLPNTRKKCWCCCGRYVYLKGNVVVKLNQNNVEFEGE